MIEVYILTEFKLLLTFDNCRYEAKPFLFFTCHRRDERKDITHYVTKNITRNQIVLVLE